MDEYQDQSAELARTAKEIERLEDMGGHDHALRALRQHYRKLSQHQRIWDRKQKFPRLFQKMRDAADSAQQEAKDLVQRALEAGPGRTKSFIMSLPKSLPHD